MQAVNPKKRGEKGMSPRPRPGKKKHTPVAAADAEGREKYSSQQQQLCRRYKKKKKGEGGTFPVILLMHGGEKKRTRPAGTKGPSTDPTTKKRKEEELCLSLSLLENHSRGGFITEAQRWGPPVGQVKRKGKGGDHTPRRRGKREAILLHDPLLPAGLWKEEE